MSMLEDFWLPRSEGGRGTEIDTFLVDKILEKLLILIIFRKTIQVTKCSIIKN
jgi:hypothetical protein